MRGSTLLPALLIAAAPWANAETVAFPAAAAFDHFYNMDYAVATEEFRAFTVAQPESAEGWNYLAQALFYSSMYECGIMGSDLVKNNDAVLHSPKVVMTPEHESEMLSALAKAESISQTRLKEHPQDTAALYALGVSYGLRANYEMLGKHAWFAGLKAANESRKLHEQVIKLDPNNYDARLVPGTHQYLVGTMPAMVRFAARAAGVSGNRAEGIRKVELAATRGEHAKFDAQVLLAVLYRREGRSEAGIPLLLQATESYPRNFIFRIELAKLYADTGDKTKAAAELCSIEKLVAQGAPGYNGTRVAQIRHQEDEVGQRIGQAPGTSQAIPTEVASTPTSGPLTTSLLK